MDESAEVFDDDKYTYDIVILPPTSNEAEWTSEEPPATVTELDYEEHHPIEFLADCCKRECCKLIPKELVFEHRLSFQELNKEEQDMVILSQLQLHRRIPQLQQLYSKHTKRKQSRYKNKTGLMRQDVKYFFCDLPICRKMYLFLHDLGEKRYKNLAEHFDKNGITPRIHQLTHRKPTRKNILEVADIESVVSFIKSCAEQLGMPLHSRLPQFQNFNVIRLPSNETKSVLHRRYCASIQSKPDLKCIARSTFLGIWKKYCPYIIVSRRTNELCEPVSLFES